MATLAVITLWLGRGVSAHALSLDIGSASGKPGDTVTIPVILNSAGAQVAGVKNDVTFDSGLPIVSCAIDPALNNGLSNQLLLPEHCTPGVDCTGVRVVVLQLNGRPIQDGGTLYSCNVKTATDATAGSHAIACSDPSASDASGHALPVTCTNGAVAVAGAGGGNGGCHIAASGSRCVPVSLLPVLMVLWRRRRS